MTIFIKVIVLILFAAIFFSLTRGMFGLVRGKNKSTETVKALTWRIVLSVILFLLLLLAFAMGWITPHPIEWR